MIINFRIFSLFWKETYYHHFPSTFFRPRQPLIYFLFLSWNFKFVNIPTYIFSIFPYLIIFSHQNIHTHTHSHPLCTNEGTRMKRWCELPKLIQLIENRAWFETQGSWFLIHRFASHFFGNLKQSRISQLVLYSFKPAA